MTAMKRPAMKRPAMKRPCAVRRPAVRRPVSDIDGRGRCNPDYITFFQGCVCRPVLKHPALHGGHVASSHSDMAWSSSMLLTGFQADFFHQPVTVEEFVSKSDAYKFGRSCHPYPVQKASKESRWFHLLTKRTPHLAIWTGVDNYCRAETGRCWHTLTSGLRYMCIIFQVRVSLLACVWVGIVTFPAV